MAGAASACHTVYSNLSPHNTSLTRRLFSHNTLARRSFHAAGHGWTFLACQGHGWRRDIPGTQPVQRYYNMLHHQQIIALGETWMKRTSG